MAKTAWIAQNGQKSKIYLVKFGTAKVMKIYLD